MSTKYEWPTVPCAVCRRGVASSFVCAACANAVTGFAEDRHLGLAIQLDTAVKALEEIQKVLYDSHGEALPRWGIDEYWANLAISYRDLAKAALKKIRQQQPDLPEKSGE